MSDAVNRTLVNKLKAVSPNVIITAELLATQYGALMNTESIANLLGVKTNTIIQKISRGDLGIEVTSIGKKWYATAFNVAQYIEHNKVQHD